MSCLKENLKQLYYFYETISNGNISLAAKRLFISPAAISIQLKKLESYSGIKLIREVGYKKITLTSAGKKLYKDLEKIFNLLDKTEKELRCMVLEREVTLSIGSSATYNKSLLPYIIERHMSLHPECKIKAISEGSISLLEKLANNTLDIVIMGVWKKLSLKSFQVHVLGQEELVLLAAPEHPLHRQKCVALKDLLHEKLIMRDRMSGSRKYILGNLKKRGVDLPVSIECESPELVKKLIIEGEGIGFLTRNSISQELEKGLFKTGRPRGA